MRCSAGRPQASTDKRGRVILKQAEIVSNVRPQMAFVDRGYKGAEIDGVKIWKSGQRRSVTRGLKAMIKLRSAIEPTIGDMKSDGRLTRNWLKGALGDAMHAVLCGAGHNLRIILRKLQLFCALLCCMLLSVAESTQIEWHHRDPLGCRN